jgi:predicted metal-dependent phosphoesterase TrpH
LATSNQWADWHDRADTMRIDLHLHSYASGTATNWWVKSLGFGFETRESYTPPEDAYRMAKQAGMDFVTLTDHETIDGALTLLDKPDFLVGEEVAATFPEDGNSVDVLIYGLDLNHHREIQSRRNNVYELVDYLRENGLVHILAHPMVSLGAPLDRTAIEKRLVLFGLWEFINGARPAEQNLLTRKVAAEVDALDLRQMATRHGLPIPPHRSIAGTGGSDDHGGLFVAATSTLIPRVNSVADLLAALAAGEVYPAGEDGSPEKIANTGFRIAGAAYMESEADESSAPGFQQHGGRSGEIEKLLEYLPLVATLSGPQIRSALAGRYERKIAEDRGVLEGRLVRVPVAESARVDRRFCRVARLHRAVCWGPWLLRPRHPEVALLAAESLCRLSRTTAGWDLRRGHGRDSRCRHSLPESQRARRDEPDPPSPLHPVRERRTGRHRLPPPGCQYPDPPGRRACPRRAVLA